MVTFEVCSTCTVTFTIKLAGKVGFDWQKMATLEVWSTLRGSLHLKTNGNTFGTGKIWSLQRYGQLRGVPFTIIQIRTRLGLARCGQVRSVVNLEGGPIEEFHCTIPSLCLLVIN